MKSNALFLSLCFALSFCLFQCDAGDEPNPISSSTLSCANNPNVCKLGEATNQFGFDMFKKLEAEKPEDNLFISPLSISSALSMTLNGANGQTKEEMLKVLGAGKINLDELTEVESIYKEEFINLLNLDNQVLAIKEF